MRNLQKQGTCHGEVHFFTEWKKKRDLLHNRLRISGTIFTSILVAQSEEEILRTH